jgi:hypothetical protein
MRAFTVGRTALLVKHDQRLPLSDLAIATASIPQLEPFRSPLAAADRLSRHRRLDQPSRSGPARSRSDPETRPGERTSVVRGVWLRGNQYVPSYEHEPLPCRCR